VLDFFVQIVFDSLLSLLLSLLFKIERLNLIFILLPLGNLSLPKSIPEQFKFPIQLNNLLLLRLGHPLQLIRLSHILLRRNLHKLPNTNLLINPKLIIQITNISIDLAGSAVIILDRLRPPFSCFLVISVSVSSRIGALISCLLAWVLTLVEIIIALEYYCLNYQMVIRKESNGILTIKNCKSNIKANTNNQHP
jgi:hypothetical protein